MMAATPLASPSWAVLSEQQLVADLNRLATQEPKRIDQPLTSLVNETARRLELQQLHSALQFLAGAQLCYGYLQRSSPSPDGAGPRFRSELDRRTHDWVGSWLMSRRAGVFGGKKAEDVRWEEEEEDLLAKAHARFGDLRSRTSDEVLKLELAPVAAGENVGEMHQKIDKQNRKDLQRDTLTVNGVTFASAQYDDIVRFVSAELVVSGEKDGEENRDEMNTTKTTDAARRLLTAVNRTHSGGLAFEKILHLFPDALIQPVSTNAEPLDLIITGGGGGGLHKNDTPVASPGRSRAGGGGVLVKNSPEQPADHRADHAGVRGEHHVEDHAVGTACARGPLALGRAHTQYKILNANTQEGLFLLDAHFLFLHDGARVMREVLFLRKRADGTGG